MSHNVTSGLFDFDEDASVGDDDGQTGNEEPESEEEFLGRFAVFSRQDRARESVGIESQVSPDAQQRRRHHQETEEPRAEYHEDDQRPSVDLVVPRRRGN